ncbi:MAG: 6-phosphogluconolactonase [Bryobacteraceae bacterium]|nr:6-phosphogluconolactonase [Bryobacteraceae bacterium]
MSTTRRAFLALPGLLPAARGAMASNNYIVYYGSYTQKSSKGIYCGRFDAAAGKAAEPQLVAEMSNPSFVALHPNGNNLYAVSEMGAGGNSVTAFAIERSSGRLRKLNTVSTKGTMPCHVNVDWSGRALAVANYGSGSVAVMALKPDGRLAESASIIQHKGKSADPRRQEGPHAHSVNISRDNRFLIVGDLGLDEVLVYKLDAATAAITPNTPPFARVKPGSGPRHFTFHPSGKYGYVINEMASTVTAFTWDGARGALKEIQTISTLPDGYKGDTTTAEVVAHPNGKFLYGSNRGHDSIAVFAIAADGRLRRIANIPTQGKTPRNFAIDPTGKWLFAANQDSDNIVIFSLDGSTGLLTATGRQLKMGSPVCVRFLAV